MEFEIIQEFKNPLLKRTEYLIRFESDGIPKKEDVLKNFCDKTSSNHDNSVVKKVLGKFGTKEVTAEIFVYEDLEIKKKLEIDNKTGESPAEAEQQGAQEGAEAQSEQGEAKENSDAQEKSGEEVKE